jgi:hypothetical protein
VTRAPATHPGREVGGLCTRHASSFVRRRRSYDPGVRMSSARGRIGTRTSRRLGVLLR